MFYHPTSRTEKAIIKLANGKLKKYLFGNEGLIKKYRRGGGGGPEQRGGGLSVFEPLVRGGSSCSYNGN